MTIRLLAAYAQYPINAIVTLDAATESGLIAANLALSNTSGGVPYVAPVEQIQYRPVMYGFNPLTGQKEITAGGEPIGSLGGGAAQTSLTAMNRPWGFGSTFSAAGSSGGLNSYFGKECIEAGITAVRAWVFSKEPANESSGWEVIVAPTDQLLNDSQSNAYIPQVGGVEYNLYSELAADKTLPSNQFGWRRAQWGGQYNDGRASASGVLRSASQFQNQSPSVVQYPVPGILVSDWIDIKTVPAVDGRHYMLWRCKKAAVTGETCAFSTDAGAAWKTASALPWYRRQFSMGASAPDGITTLTSYPATPNESNFAWQPPPIAFEYRFSVPVRSVMACGDSITENGGLQSYGRNSWVTQACWAISTPENPVVPANFGFSNSTYPNFFAQLEQAFAMGLRPTDVIIPNMSFNDFGAYGDIQTGTQFLLSQAQARLTRAIEMCKRYGARVYVTTDFHNVLLNSVNASYNQMHVDLYAFTLALGNAGVCDVIDWRAVWSPELDNGVHAYQPGLDLQAQLVAAALQS